MLRIIDTETCGLQGGIVEIASVDVIDGNIVNPMSHLIRPDRPITPQAMAIHRITEAMSPISRGLKMSYRFITVVSGMSLTMPVSTDAYYLNCRVSGSVP
ncbi:exodeoxyribonuclease X [Salmonella enterica subsp. enterica serovar Typhi]|nr:exodeoxyribonuclease X [Salmonella enterica subsp. enterica serovar Typhi]